MKITVLTAVAAFAAAVSAGGFPLVVDGQARAAFALGRMPDADAEKQAAEDIALFNTHFEKAAGVPLPLGTDAPRRIRVELKPIDDLMTRFDWRIDFPSPHEMRVTATETSLFTALRQLLEEGCDARFLGTERCMFQYEPRRNVSVAVRPRRNASANFSLLRDIYGVKGHRRELGLTDDRRFLYAHGIPVHAFPKDRYNAEGWPAAIMPVRNGKKLVRPPDNAFCGWQPCYSNPETARIAAENIRAWLKKNPDRLSVSLGVNDHGCFCQCDVCRAMDADGEKSIFSNDREWHSASYYTFVNRVAEELVPEFPKLKIGVLAYTDTIMPPPFKVHPCVVPMMTFDTLSAGMDDAVRARHESVIRRWGKKTPVSGTWDYSWGGGYWIPRVDFAGHAARLKFLHANGARAYFGENSMPDALDGPKTYLISRLLENVDADPEAVLGEWYTRFAGRAAEKPLREIYRRCTEYWRSPKMKKSAFWPARDFIYSYPYPNQYFALTPGFTDGLVQLAREVRARASTPGEKARAEVLLRHFERLDCVASFKGIAWMSSASGELTCATDAAKMLDDFTARADGLFAAWDRVRRYFLEEPDYARKGVYARAPYETLPLIAEQFGKAAGFRDDPVVVAALRRVAALECLPPETRRLLKNVFSRNAANAFSNPGFRNPLETMRFKTTLPYAIAEGKGRSGDRALRIHPGRPDGDPDPRDNVYRQVSAFTIVQDLPAGIWMVSMNVRPSVSGARGDLAVWRQTDGGDRDWEGWRPAALKKDEWHTFVQVRTVKDTEDGLNLKLRVTGFGPDDTLDIADVKILRLGDAGPSARAKKLAARRITARSGTVREEVRGEDAVVCRSDAYAFAHALVDIPRILPNENVVFTVRTTLPDGAKTGRLGAIVYSRKDGDWRALHTVLWNRRPSASAWEDISFSVTGERLGRKKGQYLLILFKMKKTDAVAVSSLSWRVPEVTSAKSVPARPK